MKKILTFQPLGNKKRSYRQREFIVSTFNISGVSRQEVELAGVEKVIRKLKKLGLNQVELGHAHHNTAERALSVCEKEGMNLIWQDLSLFGGFQNKPHLDMTEADVKAIVERTNDRLCLKGFYVWDEPWEDKDIADAAMQIEWFDKFAPGKLSFVAANPSYNPDYTWENELYPQYITRFCEEIQPSVLSVDFYPFGGSGKLLKEEEQLDNSNLWKDLAVAREESVKRNIPFWFYYQVIRIWNGPNLKFSMIRLQMNYALLYGAKGLQCYGIAGSICSPDKMDEKRRILESDFEEGCFFDDFKQQVAKVKELGKTFMALKSEHVYHSPELLANDAYFNEHFREDVAESVLDLEELPFRCTVGVLSDDYDNQYLAVLNRDYENAQSFILPLKNSYRIYEVSRADGKHYCINECTECIHVTLGEGDMVLYRLQKCGEEVSDIEYQCCTL